MDFDRASASIAITLISNRNDLFAQLFLKRASSTPNPRRQTCTNTLADSSNS
jgi:hypothetical protein